MYLRERQLKLLAILENENEYIPMRQFSNKLNVSSRTISSDIELINKIITRNGKRIKKKSGVGVKLVRENEVKHQKEIIYLINEREKRLINIIKEVLFKNEVITYKQISNAYYISKTTITNDLNYIEKILTNGNNLRLIRDNKGTRLVGSEADFRKAHVEFNNWVIKESLYDKNNFHQIIEVFNKYYGELLVNKCQEGLYSIIGKDIESISEYYVLNILNSLIVIVYRISINKNIDIITEDRYHSLKKSNELLSYIFKGTDIFFTEGDVENLSKYLISYNFKLNRLDYGSKILPEILEKLKNNFNLVFNIDNTIYIQLSDHISGMIYRLRNKIKITNPFLSQLKAKYSELFNVLWIILSDYEKKLSIKFTEDELSYLVAYLESTRAGQNDGRNILTVCPWGVASSNLLVKQIEDICGPEDKITEVSMHTINNSNIADKADLIISTIDLDIPKEKYIKIEPILDGESLENLEKYFEINREKKIKVNSFKSILKYIEQKYVWMNENFQDMSESIDYVTNLLISEDRAFEGISKSFMSREQLGGTDLKVGVATPHPNPEFVKESTIVFVQNKDPIKWINFKVKYIIFICIAEKDLENMKDIFSDLFQIVQTEESVKEFFEFLSSNYNKHRVY